MSGIFIFDQAKDYQLYPAGETIFAAGDDTYLMYAVIEGEVDIVVRGRVVETVGRGGIVGEMPLIDGEPNSASAVTRTDCKVVPIDEKRFNFMVQETPYFAKNVMQILAGRLRKLYAVLG